MNNLSPRDIYPLIVDGKEVRISCPDKRTFNSLRVALAKQHSLMVAIGGSEKSLVARWYEDSCTALYKLDQRRAGVRFNIIEIDGLIVSTVHPLTNLNSYEPQQELPTEPTEPLIVELFPTTVVAGASENDSQVRGSLETLDSQGRSNSSMSQEGS